MYEKATKKQTKEWINCKLLYWVCKLQKIKWFQAFLSYIWNKRIPFFLAVRIHKNRNNLNLWIIQQQRTLKLIWYRIYSLDDMWIYNGTLVTFWISFCGVRWGVKYCLIIYPTKTSSPTNKPIAIPTLL